MSATVIRVLFLAIASFYWRNVLCGRFNLTRPQDIVARFGFMDWSDKRPEPRFNIAPSQKILTIIRDAEGSPLAQIATWGLKPFWLNPGAAKRPPPINARAETLTSSSMFRDALVGTRCLIPATGFFEWRVLGPKQRQPMAIQRKDGGLFAFAGLWLPSQQGSGLPSAAIVTTRPNQLMIGIHTRMPAILQPGDEAAWLDRSLTDPQQLVALLDLYPAELMRAYPVSPRVNSWENEGAELLDPVEPTLQETLL